MKTRNRKTLKTITLAVLPLVLAVGCASNPEKVTSLKPIEVLETESQASGPESVVLSHETILHEAQSHQDTFNGSELPAEDMQSVSEEESTIETVAQIGTDDINEDGFIKTTLGDMPTVEINEPEKNLFHFEANQFELSETDIDTIQGHAAYLMTNPGLRLVIDAHSDSQGSAAYNYKLSGKRAQKVVNILLEHGVPRDLIIVNNYGESFPLKEEKNWDENRRVELKYSRGEQAQDMLVSTEQ